jgi:transcriptional regulator with XRE-family HTH domain
MKWGHAIAIIRRKHGMQEHELAEKTGLSVSDISLIESEEKKPSDEILDKIANAFDTDESFIALVAIDPETDIKEETKELFHELFPNFQERLLQFIK